MSVREGESSGYERIKSKKSIQQILEVATSFEESARDFYTELAPKVSKNLRWLVLELAEEEQRHYDLFTKLANKPDIAEVLRTEVDTPASDGKFSDCIQAPDLGENPDDQAVLQYALSREQVAMEQYRALADSTEPGLIKELFEFLANEETLHKNELEKLYYEVVHSGGV